MADAFQVTWTRDALKNLKRFDPGTRERIFRATELLAGNPHPPASKKLSGFEELFRLRVGNYRIIYRVREHELLIVVVSARHRRLAYRNLSD